MKIILFGAPGVGKGTQAVVLSNELQIPTIATGNILRAAVKEGTQLGLAAKEIMDSGALVPDDIIIGIIRERVAEEDCKNGFILDGMPRTLAQAKALDEHGIGADVVLSFEMADELIKQRLVGRRTCKECGDTYHVVNNPPKKENTCDKCGAELIQRSDDMPETVENRFKVFNQNMAPMLEYYKTRGILHTIDADHPMQDVTDNVLRVLNSIEQSTAAERN